MPTASPLIFLVVPCYRESARLGAFLEGLCEVLSQVPFTVAVQVVDDGSGETEAAALHRLVESLRARYAELHPALLLPENRGKGGAIYAGWEVAGESTWWGFVDADGATSPAEVRRLVEALAADPERADVWLASRVKMLGRQVDRTVRRHVMGRFYATLASLLTGLSVYDSQCGCKFFRAAAVRRVKPYLVDYRFGFDMELLAHLQREGQRMVEFPVDWQDIPGSKVHLLKDSWRMFFSLWRLRGNLQQREKGA